MGPTVSCCYFLVHELWCEFWQYCLNITACCYSMGQCSFSIPALWCIVAVPVDVESRRLFAVRIRGSCGAASLWKQVNKWTLCRTQVTQWCLVVLQWCTGDYRGTALCVNLIASVCLCVVGNLACLLDSHFSRNSAMVLQPLVLLLLAGCNCVGHQVHHQWSRGPSNKCVHMCLCTGRWRGTGAVDSQLEGTSTTSSTEG